MPLANNLLDGLISFWELEQTSGTRYDSQGSNHLSDINTVTSGAGIVYTAASFASASSERLTVNSNSTLQTGDIGFTWAFWMKLATTARFVMLGKTAGDTNDEYFFILETSTNGFIEFWVQTGATTRKAAGSTFGVPSTGVWIFVVGWHDPLADTVNISINNGATDSVTTAGAAPNTFSSAFMMGAYNSNTPTLFYNGLLDQVGFWKRVLRASERQQLFNSAKGLSFCSLVELGRIRQKERAVV